MPAPASAPASRGLSSGICGGAASPPCSPVTSSVGLIGSPRRCANSTLRVISDSIALALTQRVHPRIGSVAHDHGVVEESRTQPR